MTYAVELIATVMESLALDLVVGVAVHVAANIIYREREKEIERGGGVRYNITDA